MKKNDNGMGELLDLLKTHPELISALVFDPVSIERLLKSKAARRLVLGVDTRAFLRYVAGPKNGGPVALCRRTSRISVSQSRRHALSTWPRHETTQAPRRTYEELMQRKCRRSRAGRI
jgi:hypothetical protein